MEKELEKIKKDISKLKTKTFDLEIEMKNILKNYSKPITIQQLVVYEKADINKIAKQLNELSLVTQRGSIR